MNGRKLLVVFLSTIIIISSMSTTMAAGGSTGDPSRAVAQDGVTDDWPDSSSDATDVSPDQTHEGIINSEDDRDYLRLPVEEGDTVVLTLEKEIRKDTQMRINWPGGSQRIDGESEDTLTRKVTVEENGFVTVYVRSPSATENAPESWALSINQTPGADEWSDSSAEADGLEAGTTVSGVVNSPDDRDYMELPVDEGDVVTVELSKEIRKDTQMRIDWPGGSQRIDSESEDTLTRKVTVEEDGEVIIYVRSSSVEIEPEEWSLTVTVGEGADQWNDGSSSANDIESGERYTGTVDSPDDRDYMRLPVEQGDTVTTWLDKEVGTDTQMRIDWPGGSERIDGESEDTLTRKVTVEENGFVTIYVRSSSVDLEEEEWELETSLVRGADKWRDSSNSANDVEINSQHTGHINSPDDRDYMRVPVEEGDTLSVALRKEIRKDTQMRIDWPGGSQRIDGESEETLTRDVTVEENGFVTIYVRSSSVEIDPEPWALAIADGNNALPPELPDGVDSRDEPTNDRNTESTDETAGNQSDAGLDNITEDDETFPEDNYSADNLTETAPEDQNTTTEADSDDPSESVVELDPEYGIAVSTYDTGTIAELTTLPGINTVSVYNDSSVDADAGTISFDHETQSGYGYHAISSSGAGSLGAEYVANESGRHDVTAEFTIDDLNAQAHTDTTPVIGQASAARAGHSVHATVNVYDKTEGEEIHSETVEVQDAVTPDLMWTLIKRSAQTALAKLGGHFAGEKLSVITDSGAAEWMGGQLMEAGLEIGSERLVNIFEDDVSHSTTGETHRVDASFEAEEDHEYLIDVQFHTQTAVSSLNYATAGSTVNMNATVDGFTVEEPADGPTTMSGSSNETATAVAD